ncbi:MAG: hypothetical protein IT320_17300 [Anaerolineae bacterium]|nr:hypothetical protein [Anaerolineae bacterium]
MLGYEQLSAEEKVRRAVRPAWFEMPQVWVDALRQMPSEVKLTRSAEMWVIMRDSLYRKAIAQGISADQARRIVAHQILNCDDW